MANEVVAGDYQGQKIKVSRGKMIIGNIEINKETIDHFEVMNENSSTTSFTKGNTKKSMVGAGTKGAVGAAIGTVIAPGIGTLIGAGAGVATSKGKTKSVTKEVTTKEVTVAIYFTNGEQSLAKLDGEHYEKFLSASFSEPNTYHAKQAKAKGPRSIAGTIAWLVFFFPVGLYRMWTYNQFTKRTRIIVTTALALLTVIAGVTNR
jgi:hypothetical protein